MGTFVLVTCLCLVPPSAVHAEPVDPESRASELVEQGLTEARAGQFKQAAERFEEAFKLFPHPEIAHNLARAQQELGLLVKALTSFRQALKMDPAYIYANDARERIVALDMTLRKTHALVTVTANTQGVTFGVNSGEERLLTHQPTPTEVYLPAGTTLRVEARLKGFMPSETTHTFIAGEDASIELALRPLPRKGFISVYTGRESQPVFLDNIALGQSPIEGLAVNAGTHVLRVGSEPGAVREQVVVVVAHEEHQYNIEMTDGPRTDSAMPMRDLLGFSLAGAGGLGVLIGIPLFVLASERAADARLLSQATPSGTTTLEDLDDDYHEVRREARSLEAGAWVGTLLGAGLVGAGLALLFIDEAQSTVLVPHLDAKPDGLTLGATLSF